MAEIKKVDEISLNNNLTSIANTIRTKINSTGSLNFPEDFQDEIDKKMYLLDDLVQHKIEGPVYITGNRIGANSFSGSNITEIHGPNVTNFLTNNITETGFAPFMNCTKLTIIDLPKLQYVGSYGYQFYGCTGLTNVTLPSLTGMGQYMFYGCTNLENFIGPNVTSVSQYTFYNNTKLNTPSFPSCTSISNYSFYNCKKITGLPSINIQSIGNYAFVGSGITGDLALNNLVNIGTNAFQNCTGITSISFPATTSVGNYAFSGCKSITTINLDSATNIGNYAFDGCYNITSVCAPVAKTIGTYCFRKCAGLTSIDLPQATSIGSCGLQSCTGITTAINLSLVTTVGTYGLNACTQTPAISIPKLTSAATGVFQNNYKCTSYNLPAVTTVYYNAFCNNYELETLVLRKVTTISGASSFAGCSKLKTIDMGPSATNFNGTTTFNNCSVLDTIIIRREDAIAPLANINTFQNTPFANGGSGGTIYVPQALLSDYQAATNWSTILSYVDANEQPQNTILPLESSQYEYYYADGQAMPYSVTFDVPRYVSKETGTILAFSPITTATTIYAQDAYSNSFDFAPFSVNDFDVTILMKDQDITSTAYSVNGNIGSIYIGHILGPISITIKFHEAMGTQLFTGVSLYTKNTGGSITTPAEGWRTMTSNANASWNIQIIYKGATNLFKQMSTLYGHYIRMDLDAEWNTYVSGGLYITPGGFTSITGTPARQTYEQFVLTEGKNFNNSVIFKLPDNKNDWQYVASGGTPADTNYFSSTFYFYSNKNGSITIKSVNFYDLGTMEPES